MGCREYLLRSMLALASFGMCMVIGEVFLWLALPAPIIWKFPQEQYGFHPKRGHVLIPGQGMFTHDKPVEINSFGIRDREYSPHPAAGIRRIVALGDSQTFGNGLELSETWPKQLARMLNRHSSSSRWEALNAGIPATDAWQHELFLREVLGTYHPDVVVLALYVNDVSKSYDPRPFASNSLSNTLERRAVSLLRRSLLVTATKATLDSLRHRFWPGDSVLRESRILTGEPDPGVEAGWTQVEKSLQSMKAACNEGQVRFMVAILPRRDQVSGLQSGTVYNRRAEAIARRLRIPVLDLLEAMKEAYAEHGTRLFITWDGHNSRIANHVISARVLAKLAALGWL
jgi:lysophospholipase L1-like esterase